MAEEECLVCSEQRRVLLLPCLHPVCLPCKDDMINTTKAQNEQTVCCPICYERSSFEAMEHIVEQPSLVFCSSRSVQQSLQSLNNLRAKVENLCEQVNEALARLKTTILAIEKRGNLLRAQLQKLDQLDVSLYLALLGEAIRQDTKALELQLDELEAIKNRCLSVIQYMQKISPFTPEPCPDAVDEQEPPIIALLQTRLLSLLSRTPVLKPVVVDDLCLAKDGTVFRGAYASACQLSPTHEQSAIVNLPLMWQLNLLKYNHEGQFVRSVNNGDVIEAFWQSKSTQTCTDILIIEDEGECRIVCTPHIPGVYNLRVMVNGQPLTQHPTVEVFDRTKSTSEPMLAFGKSGGGVGCLDWPCGIATTPNGLLVVADALNNRLQLFNTAGKHERFIGDYSSPQQSRLKDPTDVAVTSNGSFWIADHGNERIVCLDHAGDYLIHFDWPQPCAIAILPDGDIVVIPGLEGLAVAILRHNDGGIRSVFGRQGKGPGEFRHPAGLAITREGLIAVADSTNQCVHVFSSDGLWLRQIGSPGQMRGPSGLAVTAADHLVVVELVYQRVSVWTQAGERLRVYGGPDIFCFPRGVCVLWDARIAVTDRDLDQVFLF